MYFLLGRFEKSASEFYKEYVVNEKYFNNEPIKRMSKLTENLLHGIDYDYVKKKRTENYIFLNEKFSSINKLELIIPQGAFMYPLYIDNGKKIRKNLQKNKIYIPMLWPSVIDRCTKMDLEVSMAENILPLPVDQRYGCKEMQIIVDKIMGQI